MYMYMCCCHEVQALLYKIQSIREGQSCRESEKVWICAVHFPHGNSRACGQYRLCESRQPTRRATFQIFKLRLQYSALSNKANQLACNIAVMSHLTRHPSAANESANESVDDFSILSSEHSPDSLLENDERPITPIIKRVASIRLPHDESEKELTELAPMLEINLTGNVLDNDTNIINVLFPDEILPFQIDEALLHSLPSTVYDSAEHKWVLRGARTESVSKFLLEHLNRTGTGS